MSNGQRVTTRKGHWRVWIVALFGVLGLVVAAVLASSTVSFMASAERTEGSVRGVSSEITTSYSDGASRRKKKFTATVFFTDAAGDRVSFESSAGSGSPNYEVGDTVPVAYNPDDPADARIASFWSAYSAPLGIGGAGLALIVIAAVSSVLGRRAPSPRRDTIQPTQPTMGGGHPGRSGYPGYPDHTEHSGYPSHPDRTGR